MNVRTGRTDPEADVGDDGGSGGPITESATASGSIDGDAITASSAATLFDESKSDSREVTLFVTDAVDGECLAGTFSLTFSSGTVTGTFGAPKCD